MKELDPRARELVRGAASAEAERVLSPAQREEIRRRFLARRSAEEPPARGRASLPAAAGLGAVLAFGVPAWAAVSLGLAVGGGIAAAVVVTREHAARPAVSVAARIAQAPPGERDAVAATPDPGPAPAPPDVPPATIASVAVEPSRPPPRRVVTSPVASPAASQSSGGSLGAEAALLQSAERALRDHDGARALALLDEHARRFPDGVLLVEAEAARAIATCDTGDRDQGSRLAADFARRWADAPVVARVLAACRTPRSNP
jgi:hypothetical protein